jgi:acetylornithine deacetylase/succinyl-diaminopimelate desuccinylase-like protein
MDLERWIQRTLTVQGIPAPTFGEAERARYLMTEFRSAGLREVELNPLGNLYARVPGNGRPPLVVSAHLDSVFSPATDLAHRRSRTRLTGPGIGDNAVALAALVELAFDLRDRRPAGDIWLVANVCEEGLGNLRGMIEVVERFGKSVAAYLVLEGMALGHIYHRALPVRRYRLQVRARGGHAWIHWDRPSALHKLLRLGEQLLRIPLPREPRTTLNIGTMSGGRSINTIADEASLELDLRSESDRTLEELEARIQETISRHQDESVAIRLDLVGSRPGGDLGTDHPLVLAASESLRRNGERDRILEAGSTDASVPLNRGLPGICVGLTKGGEAHTLHEYIEIRPMRRGYLSLVQLMEAAILLDARP